MRRACSGNEIRRASCYTHSITQALACCHSRRLLAGRFNRFAIMAD
ncbi:hypothetical protein EDWATA_00686 [Edwardsiella tarda ATCC 23685]|uniref:Uncharacterized protein n=1 Tax=Edwardsiella tarda ATCC 23685 TaxID=500638 RepID=D4F1U2_EDWTA|nr:hypothetical protein EDWATA_00686 [Edwardsiella tarda ATCC 23685]